MGRILLGLDVKPVGWIGGNGANPKFARKTRKWLLFSLWGSATLSPTRRTKFFHAARAEAANGW